MSEDFKKILIIDYEEQSRSLLKMYLEKEPYVIEEAEDGETGLFLLLQGSYDLVILDLMLPGINGLEVCSLLRQIKSTPVIMLSTRGEDESRVKAYKAGVDDYIVKPTSLLEITHRVKAVLRRALSNTYVTCVTDSNNLVFPQFVIEWGAHRVSAAGQQIYLTPKEFKLLYYMSSRPDTIFSRGQLLQEVWGYESVTAARTVDTHIKRMRDKLNKISPEAASMIKTIWGFGYMFKIVN